MPLFGVGVIAMEGLFCPREATPAVKELTVKLIGDRQLEIHEGRSTKSPLMIFPEGTTSNGTSILPFRRGAFQSLLPVRPVSLKYPNYNTVHPANEVLKDHVVLILSCCNLFPTFIGVNLYPIFEPTEYLWEQHADKGKQKWEIYAWAIRDILSKHTGLTEECGQSYAEKLQYFKYMSGAVDSYRYEGTYKDLDEEGEQIIPDYEVYGSINITWR